MENKTLNTQIEEAFNSVNGIKRAQANPFLATRVMEQLKHPAAQWLKPRLIWQVALSMVIVLVLNIGAGLYVAKNQGTSSTPNQEGYFTNQTYTY